MKEICFAIKYLQWGSGGKNVIRGGRYNLYTLNKRGGRYNLYTLNKRIVWGVSGVKKKIKKIKINK